MKSMILFVLALCVVSFARGNKASEAACYETAQDEFASFMHQVENHERHHDPRKSDGLILQGMLVIAQMESIEKGFAKNNGNVCTYLRTMTRKIDNFNKASKLAEIDTNDPPADDLPSDDTVDATDMTIE